MIGQIVSHYEILSKLGQGGMGVVYLARDTRLDRLVALKFLPPELIESLLPITRFEQEARAISALNHPNIATIHDMEQVDGRRFLVLEYLPGGTLKDKLRVLRLNGQQMPLGQCLSIGIQIADGLAHAHRAGITHRDVKSENVMFTAEGMARITDFGLAKTAHRAEITRDGTTVGTAAYMSPEQATGEAVDGRTDIFSLGILLYEMAAGARPFGGDNEVAVLHAILQKTPPPLSDFREVPDGLQAVLLKALEKDRYRRYQRAEDLAADLRALQNRLDPSAGRVALTDSAGPTVSLDRIPSAPKEVPAGWSRTKNKTVAAAIAGVVLIPVVIAVLFPRIRDTLIQRPGALPSEKHIVVLPFSSLGKSGDEQAFATGLAEILEQKLTLLARSHRDSWVVPESDVYGNSVTTPAEARRLFRVSLAIAGTVKRTGDHTELDLKLLDAGTGKLLRERAVSKSGSDLASLQDEVVGSAAAMLGFDVEGQALSRIAASGTFIPTAYDDYVKANGYIQRYDRGGIDAAIALFQEAIRRDPNYALAYAGLGEAYWTKYVHSKDVQYLEQARTQTEQAISRNAAMASPHITLGVISTAMGQQDSAVAQLREAIRLDPVNAAAYRALGNSLAAQRKPAEAEEMYKKAIQLRPNFWLGHNDLAIFYSNQGRYNEAETALRKVIDLTPDNQLSYRNLGGVYAHEGRYKEAEEMLKKSIGIRPTAAAYTNLGTVYFYEGRYGDAVPMMEKAVALAGQNDGVRAVAWNNLAEAYRWNPDTAAKAPEAYRKSLDLSQSQLAINPENAVLLSRTALCTAHLGEIRQALVSMEKARRLAPRDLTVLSRSVIVYELAKERGRALAALDSALRGGYRVEEVSREPDLAGLRADPRYSKLIRKRQESKGITK
ncbi:MAG: protein kinase domain-containing protein [Bryobacteraceae bacterium]